MINNDNKSISLRRNSLLKQRAKRLEFDCIKRICGDF